METCLVSTFTVNGSDKVSKSQIACKLWRNHLWLKPIGRSIWWYSLAFLHGSPEKAMEKNPPGYNIFAKIVTFSRRPLIWVRCHMHPYARIYQWIQLFALGKFPMTLGNLFPWSVKAVAATIKPLRRHAERVCAGSAKRGLNIWRGIYTCSKLTWQWKYPSWN